MTFPFQSIGFWLARRAALTPNRIALVTPDARYRYEELEDRAARTAGALAAAGVHAGDRVATYLPNGVDYVDVFFAVARLGAIIVPLSTRLTATELTFIVSDAQCSTFIHDDASAGLIAGVLPGTPVKTVLTTSALSESGSRADPHEVREASWDNPLAIIYTSGTTGRPKGAVLSHGNFFWTNLNMALALDLAQDERSLVVLPMFHIGGWNVNTLSVWWKGGTVYLEPGFDAGRVLSLIQSERITSVMGVPTIYQLLEEHPSFAATDVGSVRTFICGGAPLPVGLIRRYQDRGLQFIQGYGLTEAAPNCLILPPEDAVTKAGAAGRPYFFCDVRVVDADNNDVPAGSTGEIIVGGPSVMLGYWNLPEETAASLRDGWLRTGDVGRIDEDGTITIVDRTKDMYISGGENVYPAEIEQTLSGHPAIAEAAVIGVADERWGETGRAIVVLREGVEASADEIRAWSAERLAKFKVPRDIIFADALPRTPTGKLLKPELRTTYGGRST